MNIYFLKISYYKGLEVETSLVMGGRKIKTSYALSRLKDCVITMQFEIIIIVLYF